MHTNSPRETGVRRYRITVDSYKIGKRAKVKRAEMEARQSETRRSGSAPKRNAPNWNRVKMKRAKLKRAKLTHVKAERANVARNPIIYPALPGSFGRDTKRRWSFLKTICIAANCSGKTAVAPNSKKKIKKIHKSRITMIAPFAI